MDEKSKLAPLSHLHPMESHSSVCLWLITSWELTLQPSSMGSILASLSQILGGGGICLLLTRKHSYILANCRNEDPKSSSFLWLSSFSLVSVLFKTMYWLFPFGPWLCGIWHGHLKFIRGNSPSKVQSQCISSHIPLFPTLTYTQNLIFFSWTWINHDLFNCSKNILFYGIFPAPDGYVSISSRVPFLFPSVITISLQADLSWVFLKFNLLLQLNPISLPHL